MPGPGTRIDRFVIERLLGRGGMAEVYAARDTQLRRLVALKRLRSDRDDAASMTRILREARAAASFQHPGAVIVYDVFEHDGAAYMAMELVAGRSMRSYVGDASIPIERRLRWLVDVARALGAAHRAGLVHRDVKPHNVMVRDDGAVKVLDFGIARAHQKSREPGEDTSQSLGTLTETGAIVGTPLYASPEQLSAAAVDARSDQFAWGVMGYELCCGLLPWRRRDTLTMLAQLVAGDIPTMLQRIADAITAHQELSAQSSSTRSAPPPPNPALYADIPPEVELILRRTLRRDPEERYPTIDDAADELEELAEAPPSTRYTARAAFPSIDPFAESGQRPAFSREDPEAGRALRASSSTTPGPGAQSSDESTPISAGTERSPGQQTPRHDTIEPPATSPTPVSPSSTTGSVLANSTITPDRNPSDPPPLEDTVPVWRRTPVWLAAFAFIAAGAVGLASALQEPDPTPGGATSAETPASAVVSRLACAAADVTGDPKIPDAPALFGKAACVRAAIAVGVPWGVSSGSSQLAVRVDAGPTTRVTLTLAGQTATGEAEKPMVAVDAAARALAAKITAPPASADRQAELGTTTSDSARRVEGMLRRRAARIAADPAAELAEALAAAPRSPWPRVIALADASGAKAPRLRDEIIHTTSTLPDALAEAARGAAWHLAPAADADRDGALPALRRAYAARPEDGLVAAELAGALLSIGQPEEAAAIGLRIAERAPDQSLATLARLVQDDRPDPAWVEQRGRLLSKLTALLPEARAWESHVVHDALAGRIEEARQGLALADSLGLPGNAGGAWTRDLARAAVEIADLHPAAARPFVQPSLGSPSAAEAALATRLLVQSHLLEGRVADAETALARDIARLEALGDQVRSAERWTALLRIRRRLGVPAPELADLTKLDALAAALEAKSSAAAPALRAEVFLARVARKEKKPSDAAEVQAAIDAYARKLSGGDRTRHDDVAAAAMPVALVGSGTSGLRALSRSLDRASPSARLPHLLAIAAVAEEDGALADAEAHYRALVSAPLAVDGLTYLAARVRLARVLERSGRKEEAATLAAATNALLAGADDGVAQKLEHTL